MDSASSPTARSSPHPDDNITSALPGLPMLLKLLCVMVIIAVLTGVSVPVFVRVELLGHRARALAQARSIGMVLRLYASDHEGVYPAGENQYQQRLLTSNDVFRGLFPEYTQSEVIFGNDKSVWQFSRPDNRIAPLAEILRPGENVLDYVAGLNDAMNPNLPIVADGTDGSGLGTYVSDPRLRGGVWKGERAIVIRLDSSGKMEPLAGPPQVRSIVQKFSDGTRRNLLGKAALEGGLQLLEPASTPAPKPSPNRAAGTR